MRALTLPPYPLRRLAGALAVLALALAATPGARAASTFYIRGGGDGHGIGMSQYGAYGYALHGASYRTILAHYYQGTALGRTDPGRVVRVLLATGRASFSGATAAAGTALRPAQAYMVKALASGRLQVVGSSGKRVGSSFASPLTVTGPAPLTVGGLGAYRGALQFRPDGHGGVQTVNAVALDDYVRGVVAGEMPSGWAPQALAAQAVAARTYAITTTVGGNGYDLYDDTRSQMYGGVGAESTATDAAVAATRGQIVTYRGQPAVTFFFASSGGHTEDIQYVWPGATAEPWLRGVADPYDGAGGDPYHQWGADLSLSAAAAKLRGLLKGSLVGIAVTRHGVSPRIVEARVTGTRGSTTVSGDTLQQVFGLMSTDASFTTITTNASPVAVSGSIYPSVAGATYWIQAEQAGRWHTIARATLGAGGAYRAAVPGPGTYRIQFQHLNGPALSAATGRLARYAWALAGHRRPVRPLPLLLRAARLDHRPR